MKINQDKITQAILDLNVSPLAAETGAALADHWISEDHPEIHENILGVEMGFVLWLDDKTVAIGVQDLVTEGDSGPIGNEWKTSSASKWWTEDRWLKDLVNGPQLGLYALGLHRGTYYEAGSFAPVQFLSPTPKIRVRAITKTNPPAFWPRDPEDSTYVFDAAKLRSVEAGFRARAEAIRALRRSALTPWELMGSHCFAFNKVCQFFDKHCSVSHHPSVLEAQDATSARFDPSDPASHAALIHIPEDKLNDPDLVVLSASSYKTGSNCMEQYRIISGSLAEKKESSIDLEIGTVLHAAIGQFYSLIRDEQRTISLDMRK